jgi:hypothetical protein
VYLGLSGHWNHAQPFIEMKCPELFGWADLNMVFPHLQLLSRKDYRLEPPCPLIISYILTE